MKRNSGSPADGDYLGQLKFKGENDADQEVIYAKITGKISDASDTTEDGLLEFTLKKAGSNNIGARLTSTDLKLINGTGLEVAGDVAIGGTTVDPLSLSFTGTGLALNEDSGTAFMQIDGGNGSRIDFGVSGSRNTTLYADGSVTELGRTTSHPVVFKTNNTERVRIDAAGRLMIGTTTEGQADADDLTVANASGNVGISLRTTTTGYASIYFSDATSGGAEASGAVQYKHDDNFMRFTTAESERVRIDSSGNLLVGKTSATQSSAGFQISGSNFHNVTSTNSGTGSSTFMVHDGSQLNFYVNFTGQVHYRVGLVNLSDQRLKENVINLDKGLDDILKIKPRRFDWIEGEGEKNQIGFIAQEVEEAGLEELVSHYKGASLDDAKGVNQAGLIPILVKAIQEQQTIIEDLQTQINEVKNGN